MILKSLENINKKIDTYCLAIKYWLQGQEWKEAFEYAEALVMGWKNR